MPDELKVFTGNANPELAQNICDYLGVPLGDCTVTAYKDGELSVKINENIRGVDVFIVNPSSPPVNRNLMELLILIDAASRASADRITAVVPYYGYARQDWKDEPRVPITSKLVANLITVAGADRVLTMDLHADQIQGFFDIPVDHLFAAPVFIDYLSRKGLNNLVVAAPDAGGVKRARWLSKRMNATLAILDKRRPRDDVSEVMAVIGDVKDCHVVISDDIISTGGTLVQAADALKREGADKIYACCTHAILSGPAREKLRESCLEELVVTNTIPVSVGADDTKLKVLCVAPLLGEAIKRIHEGQSVSSLFV